MENQAIEEFIQLAFDEKVPQDQLMRFLGAGYISLPWQLKFHAAARECDQIDGPTSVGAGGARGPGKSHAVLAQMGLDDCQRIPGLKCLFLRQTGASARESFGDLILKVLHGRVKYKNTLNSLKFPNGSRILLGGFQDERDIDKYVGIEYDLIGIEEINQLTEEKIEKLKGSLRTSKQDWRARLYCSFNPGNIGHSYVKKTFVDPYYEKEEDKTRFIPATYRDNIYLKKEYNDYLEGLSGNLGKAWRDGDFDSFAGQFFIEWNRDKHVVMPFKIPASWRTFRVIDPSGRNGTTCCYWLALDNDGTVWCYREYQMTGKDSDEHAKTINEWSDGEEYPYTIIDSSAFAKVGLPETTAEVYMRNGVSGLVAASKDRVQGWDFMHQYMRHDRNNDPKIKFFNTCAQIIKHIPLAIHDDLKPEDIKSFYEGAYHQDDLDCIRYFLQTLRAGKTPDDTPRSMSFVEMRLAELKRQRETSDY